MKFSIKMLFLVMAVFVSGNLWVAAQEDAPEKKAKKKTRIGVVEKLFDEDGDNVLNEDETAAFNKYQEELALEFDKDDDGELSEEERAAFEKFQKSVSPLQLARRAYKKLAGKQYRKSTRDYQKKNRQVAGAGQDRAEAEKKREAQYAAYRQEKLAAVAKELEMSQDELASYEKYRKKVSAGFDQNGDGELNKKEQAAYRKAQESYQKINSEGGQSDEEQAEYSEAQQTAAKAYQVEVSKAFDLDQDGELSKKEAAERENYYELVRAEAQIDEEQAQEMREKQNAYYEQTRQLFDQDEDGQLSEEEKAAYDAYVQKMREPFDKDKDGELSEEEQAKYDAYIEQFRNVDDFGSESPELTQGEDEE